MRTKEEVQKLQEQKEDLRRKLFELNLQYRKGELEEKEYLDRKYELLGGKFEEDVFKELDEKIESHQGRKKMLASVTAAIILMGMLVPMMNFQGITGFAALGPNGEQLATMQVGKNYTNTTLDYSFINTTTLQVSGKVYGYGEAWIYLVSNGQRRLVHYADTRQDNAITGNAVGIPVNDTNVTPNQTANQTINTENQTVNSTTSVANGTNNATVNSTNSTDNSTNETQVVEEPFNPEIQTDKDTYSIGETVQITVLPENSTYTLYLYAPDDTYILRDDNFTASTGGEHTLTSLITKGNNTERAEKTFNVEGPLQQQTGIFRNACVETCDMGSSETVTLEVVVSGTKVELDNITYISQEQNVIENVTNNTEPQPKEIIKTTGPKENKQLPEQAKARSCLHKNPNLRDPSCFTEEEKQEFFSEPQSLVSREGTTMAVFEGDGDLLIKGTLIENTNAAPQQFDLEILGNGGAVAWVDALTGDLYLRGQLYEQQQTLNWKSRKDYVVNNQKGIYLGIFDAQTGDLYIRGQIQEGGLS